MGAKPTERLYEEDPALFAMEATLVSRALRGTGEEVVLDRTVFFAPSGGQAQDTGTLAGVPVVAVERRGDEIVHVTSAPLPSDLYPGGRVVGAIDVARRLDHMRQHHGQHLLSAAFLTTARVETTSVHFGAESSTLDLARPVPEERIAEAADLANRIVLEDRPVRVHRVGRGELERFALRKEPGVEAEILRIVEVEGFDATPCSGTHPLRTGQVGPIVVVGTSEKVRGGARLTFLCGERALRDHRAKDATVTSLARDLSVAATQVSEAVSKLRVHEKALRARVRAAEGALASLEARDLAARDHDPLVYEVGPDRNEDYVSALAAELVALGRRAILGFRSEGRGSVVVSLPKGAAGDATSALRVALALLEGKGGGSGSFARGTGPRGERLPEALAAAAKALSV